MQNKFTMLMEVHGQLHNFQFVDSPAGHYTISLLNNIVVDFKVCKDDAGKYRIDPNEVVPQWAYDLESTIHDYIELGKHFFTKQTISIVTNGYTVIGELDGSTKWWTFKSTDEYFLSLLPNGHLASFSLFIDPIPFAIEDIYNKLFDAMDAILIVRGAASIAA